MIQYKDFSYFIFANEETPHQPVEGHGKDGRREERWPGAENLNPLGVGRGAKNDYDLNTDGGGMNDRWKSVARCAEGMLSNLAVVGIGLALFEQKWWPTLAIGTMTAAAALLIAWKVNHD